MEHIINFLAEVGKLKDTKRAGWVLKEVPDPESVADHSYRTAVLAMLLSEKSNLDKNRCIQMALVHDMGEAVIGDITPHDGISEEEKHVMEAEAVQKLFKELDPSFLELWKEYEERQTPEAQFIYELDKVEMLIQAYEYGKRYPQCNLDEFWEYVEKRVENPQCSAILKILQRKRRNPW